LAQPTERRFVREHAKRLIHYHGNLLGMALARSRLTAQGQISVPAEIRRRLGVGPGSVLEWNEEGEKIVVRRAGKYTSEEIHKVLFPNGPPPRRSLAELKEGIREYMRRRHARR
jgi:antitoxin PrlF